MLRRLALVLLGIVVGAVGTYFSLRVPSHKWMPLIPDQHWLYWNNNVLFGGDIPFPNLTPIEGQAKFVDRGVGKGIELGYAVHTNMDKLDLNKLPEKYKKVEEHGNFSIGPIDTAVYTAHLEFTLKDGDGFTLMTTQSEPFQIWSGRDNKLQGFAKDPIPEATVKRTRSVLMTVGFETCNTCEP